jgi:hypothetical protein
MSLEKYVRLRGAELVAAPESFPESVIECILQIADRRPEIGAGLADDLEHSETFRGFRPR